MSIKNPKKVEITISNFDYNGERCRFAEGCEKKGVSEYTRVDYGTFGYGGASPCIDNKEVNNAIEHAKETIIKEGDIPIVNDERVKKVLTDWF